MAKRRGRPRNAGSLDMLVAELNQLNERRRAVVDRIRQATETLLGGESPFPWRQGGGGAVGNGRKRGRPVGSKSKTAAASDGGMVSGGRKRKRRKMSAAARKAISDAQKRRWANQKAEKN